METIKQKINTHKILLIILVLAAFFHFFRLDYPNAYVFDEVYHGFTAKEYLKGSKEAWEWWTTPPPGVAFEWTHPPLAKEIMTVSMYILSFFTSNNTDAFGWRLPGAILGVISVFLIYKLGERIFNKNVGLVSAFLFSFDGLNFVQSRTGMNDVYVVTFALASLLFLLNKKLFISAIFLGLAFASKWSALYLIGLNSLLLIYFFTTKRIESKSLVKGFGYIAILLPLIYLITYLPFFKLENSGNQFFINQQTIGQFVNVDALLYCQLFPSREYIKDNQVICPFPFTLQNQMLNYHTHLVATHDYSSPAWSWPLNLYPVWYFVEYQKGGWVSNIFASGNPVLFWMGIGALIITIYDFVLTYLKPRKDHEVNHKISQNSQINFTNRDRYLIILLGFFAFWLPWIFSPRIMFLYHYSPSVPFLCLSLGYQVELMIRNKSSRVIGLSILGLILLGFLLVYPMLTGIPLPREVFVKFFDFNLTKNPFAQ